MSPCRWLLPLAFAGPQTLFLRIAADVVSPEHDPLGQLGASFFGGRDVGVDRDSDWYGYGSKGAKDLYGAGKDPYGAGKDPYGAGKDPYGSAYSDPYGYGSAGYGDYFGGYSGAGLGDQRKDLLDDECSRVEANGVPLADTLREAAEDLQSGDNASDAADVGIAKANLQVLELVRFFASEQNQRRQFLLTHCPQAVALAVLLQAEVEASRAASDTDAGEAQVLAIAQRAVSALRDVLTTAPSLRSQYKAPPSWTGKPWEGALNAAQGRTGVVIFPTGEQSFHVEFIPPANWSIHPRRRCAGCRDLGNLQATPLATCLEKCLAHPSCRSATFWQWQPGFQQRCFLSSSCTNSLTTDEGAEGAVLFQKRAPQSQAAEEQRRQTVRTPGGAPWAPRAGHRLLASLSPRRGGGTRLWLLGGAGVDPFFESKSPSSSGSSSSSKEGEASSFSSGPADRSNSRGAASAGPNDPLQPKKAQPADRIVNATSSSNVVEAYLSRHVELNAELPPLRSLPYGRLADIWRSDDAGATWTLETQTAPWGSRAFFGAVAVQGGRGLLVMGGVRTPKGKGALSAAAESAAVGRRIEGLSRKYVNDVWLADLYGGGAELSATLSWRKMAYASWSPRASFQVLTWHPSSSQEGAAPIEELLVLGGRLADGSLVSDVWALKISAGFETVTSAAPSWRQLAAAAWSPRADFAAAASNSRLWVLGGADQAGLALSDVWYSADGSTWHQVLASAPWASRIGPVATVLQGGHQVQNREALLLFGGYAYPDTNFTPLSAAPLSSNESGHSTQTPHWAAAAWASADGVRWVQLDPEKMAWTPGTMHAALAAAPCSAGGPSRGARPFGSGDPTCAFAAGGLLNEGYYDNTVHKLQLPTAVWDSDSETSLGVERPLAGLNSSSPSEGISLAVAGEVGGKFLEALLADEVLAMK
ncbi:unnamed protein product, partial [Polarella glacialis]